MWPRPHYIIANTPTEQSTEKPKSAEEEILWNVIRFECDFLFLDFRVNFYRHARLWQSTKRCVRVRAWIVQSFPDQPSLSSMIYWLNVPLRVRAQILTNLIKNERGRERERKPTEIIPDHEKGQRIRYTVYTEHTQSLNCVVVVVIVATIAYANIFFSSTQTNL